MSTSPLPATKGFFAALFDFSFTSFITLKFMKVIYAIVVGAIALIGLLVFLAALASGEASSIVLAFVLVPTVMLVYLVLARISMEFVAVLFRIGENTAVLAAQATSAAPFGPAPGAGPGYGGYGGYGGGPAPGTLPPTS